MTCEKCDDTGIIYGAVIEEGIGWVRNNTRSVTALRGSHSGSTTARSSGRKNDFSIEGGVP